MTNCLTLTKLSLNRYDFRLLWNGRALFNWTASGLSTDNIPDDPHTTAYILHLMGTEAAAVCRVCGYPVDNVPTVEELEHYLTDDPLFMPWERQDIVTAISSAFHFGNHREQEDKGEEKRLDLDTIELKKN